MDFDLYHSEICLKQNAPIRLLSARGVRITCTAGVVWLTVEGEAGDIFLFPGDEHLVSGRGLALLEALGHGRVRFARVPQPLPSLLPLRGRWWLRTAAAVSLFDRHAARSLSALVGLLRAVPARES